MLYLIEFYIDFYACALWFLLTIIEIGDMQIVVIAVIVDMAQPLFDDFVEYEDGTPATVEQMSADLTEFLAWAADPQMETRKNLGWRVVVFLACLTLLFIALKMEVWAHLKGPNRKRVKA